MTNWSISSFALQAPLTGANYAVSVSHQLLLSIWLRTMLKGNNGSINDSNPATIGVTFLFCYHDTTDVLMSCHLQMWPNTTHVCMLCTEYGLSLLDSMLLYVFWYPGNVYNIPVCIWIHDTHPQSPPKCFLRPSDDMVINPKCSCVDSNGHILLQCLGNWHHVSHCCLLLCCLHCPVTFMYLI